MPKNILGPIRSFTVKENYFDPLFTEILHYRQKRLLLYIIGYRIYVDIMTGEKFSSVGSSSRRGGKRVRGMDGGIVILAFC